MNTSIEHPSCSTPVELSTTSSSYELALPNFLTQSRNINLWVIRSSADSIHFICLWDNCNVLLNTIMELDEHLSEHMIAYGRSTTSHDSWSCCVKGCEISISSVDELSRHMKMHVFHAQKQFNGMTIVRDRYPTLTDCNFPSSSRLVYQGDALICEWDGCTQSFENINEYVSHLSLHIDLYRPSKVGDENTFNCLWGNDCTFFATGKGPLRIHIQHHSGDKMCACPFCGMFFANHTKFLDHLLRRQEGDDEFCCILCQKSFLTARLLKIHCQRHIQRFTCSICSVAVNSAFDLRRHIEMVHAKIRSHFCEKCNKGFYQKSDLTKHMAVHSDVYYECEFCDKKYHFDKQLKHHLKTHDKDHIVFPYLCHLCNRKYRRGSALSKHFVTVHELSVPAGFSCFQYKKCGDGLFRLQTKRYLSKSLVESNEKEQ